MKYVIVLLLLFAAGCTDPDIDSQIWICASDRDCGSGWFCFNGICEPESRREVLEADQVEITADTNSDTHEDSEQEEWDVDTDLDTEPDSVHEPDEDEVTPPCEDLDHDGYPGSGTGCNPQDPNHDCNDGNDSIHPGAEETCDLIDNDCDRLIDTVDDDLETPLCPLTEGVCVGLHSRCVDGNLVGCASSDYGQHSGGLYVPIEDGLTDLCDGYDNDCDGFTDENLSRDCYTGPGGTLDVGVCHGGMANCDAGAWGGCEGEVTPDVEGNNMNCDGLDNDCDQIVDEECECVYDAQNPPSQPCYTGPDPTRDVGVCHDGVMMCQPNNRWGLCQGDRTPGQELCSNPGTDDDCDGIEDNILYLGAVCTDPTEQGICQRGEYRCQGGNLVCISTTAPQDEACGNMGADDDCNGELDDIALLGNDCLDMTQNGICQNGTRQCRGTTLLCVSTTAPQQEECNGIDESCSGSPDDAPDLCSLPHASSECVDGTCRVLECDPNAYDEDGADDNGCEVWCDPSIRVELVAAGNNGEIWGGRAITWNGSGYGIAYTRGEEGHRNIYFVRTDSEGVPLGDEEQISNNDSDSTTPAIVWTGSQYGIAWKDERDGNGEIYFARVSSSGVKIGDDTRVTNNAAFSTLPAIAWGGSNFGLLWVDDRDTTFEIYFARLSSTGVEITFDKRVTYTPFSAYPSLVWAEDGFGVTWHDYDYETSTYDLYFAKLSTNGTKVISDVPIAVGVGNAEFPSLVWTGSTYAVTWEDDRVGNKEIYFTRISTDGNKQGGDIRVTEDPSPSKYPVMSWNGSEYSISWMDGRLGRNATYFIRLDSNGARQAMPIFLGDATCGRGYNSSTTSSTQHAVVWENSSNNVCRVEVSVFECGDEGQ